MWVNIFVSETEFIEGRYSWVRMDSTYDEDLALINHAVALTQYKGEFTHQTLLSDNEVASHQGMWFITHMHKPLDLSTIVSILATQVRNNK